MRYILENDTLRVEIESFGAEIKSVKRKADGREYPLVPMQHVIINRK